jgi:putative pyruvate formate lyase activating enzyme
MEISRRDFLKSSLILGGSLLCHPLSLRANQKKEDPWRTAYEKLENEGKLVERIEQAHAILEACELCPRQCGVNRLKGEKGFCQAPHRVVVFSAQPHFGEEISLVGKHGSGTIFFSNCNLRCIFCQNWPIAHEGRGTEFQDADLAEMMLNLQKIGCHNINLVTPTHEIIKLLDGIVDIYMPDMKYMDADQAAKYSSDASDYPEVAKQAIIEMNRQVGELQVDRRGIALSGLIIRHLVMPDRVAGTEKFTKWVAENLPKSTYVNIMPQYHVDYKAYEYPEIARGITVEEFLEAMDWAEKDGLTNLDPKSVAVRNFYLNRLSK